MKNPSRAFAEMKTRGQFVCQSWKQADEGALVFPHMRIDSKLMFQVPMYWTACVGYALRNESGKDYVQFCLIPTTVPYRLKNISDTFTDYLHDLEQEVNKDHVIGQFYILATGKGRERVFTDAWVEEVTDFMDAHGGPARWEEKPNA